jgi:hypothetical protein
MGAAGGSVAGGKTGESARTLWRSSTGADYRLVRLSWFVHVQFARGVPLRFLDAAIVAPAWISAAANEAGTPHG